MCSQEAQGERERRNERERTEKSDDDEIQHRFFATEVLLESFGLRFFFFVFFFCRHSCGFVSLWKTRKEKSRDCSYPRNKTDIFLTYTITVSWKLNVFKTRNNQYFKMNAVV